MTDTIHVERAAVAAIVAATFPGYAGKRFKIVARERVTISDLNWSGGTRSEYVAVTLDGRRLGDMSEFNAKAPWDNRAEGASTSIPAGACIVEHSIFCGRDMGLTIYVRPDAVAKYLPAPCSDISAEHMTVMRAIRTLIPRARREECARAGINAARYDAIVAELKTAGYCSANGGLTLKGKNSCAL